MRRLLERGRSHRRRLARPALRSPIHPSAWKVDFRKFGYAFTSFRCIPDAYLGEVIPLAEYERRRRDLEHRDEALSGQERQLQAQAHQRMELAGVVGSVEDSCERVRSGLADATFEHRRKLVELLIDRVIVTDEEVEIRYVIPTTPESEHVRFCHLRSDYLHHPAPRGPKRAGWPFLAIWAFSPRSWKHSWLTNES